MQFLIRLIHISLQNMNDIARNTIYGGFLANPNTHQVAKTKLVWCYSVRYIYPSRDIKV